MYTLEEIEERGKLHFQMTVVKWIVGFGIIFPIFMGFVLILLSTMTDSRHALTFSDILSVLTSIYLSPLYLGLMVISTPLIGYGASKAIKKKMLEENAEKERQEREEHYRKMEELLEKISKDKETT